MGGDSVGLDEAAIEAEVTDLLMEDLDSAIWLPALPAGDDHPEVLPPDAPVLPLKEMTAGRRDYALAWPGAATGATAPSTGSWRRSRTARGGTHCCGGGGRPRRGPGGTAGTTPTSG